MNREIKFRGKDRENWHYGDLVQEIRHNDNKLFDGTMTHIRNFEYKNGDYIGDSFPVNPDTIGQYTGLQDENGKEIYEGDIVRIIVNNNIEKICRVEFKNGIFGVMFSKNKDLTAFPHFCNTTFEVIGNVFENGDILNDSKNTEKN